MLEKIIDSCKYVCDNPKYVKIDYDKLDSFVDNINSYKLKNWLLYNLYNLLDLDIELIINMLLIFESICYSFWGSSKWIISTNEGNKDGSDALLYIMIKYVRDNKNIDFSEMSFGAFANLLKGNVEIPLLEERYKTVVSVSQIVNEKMGGSFYKYIYNVRNDKELFEIIVRNFSCFKDERTYNGKTI